jgi:hypothetical protein
VGGSRTLLVWPGRVELDQELLGAAGQVEDVGDVFAKEPLVLQRLERPFPTPFCPGVLTGVRTRPQLRVRGDECGEAERSAINS